MLSKALYGLVLIGLFSNALGQQDPNIFIGIRDSAVLEVKSITAAAGATVRFAASQIGVSLPYGANAYEVPDLSALSDPENLASSTAFQTAVTNIVAELPGCTLLTKTITVDAKTKIATPFDISCVTSADELPVASVSFSQEDAGLAAGTCFPIPAAMQAMPTVKITVTCKSQGVYTTVSTLAVPGLIDITATFKWPYLNTVPTIVDPTKATAFFTGATTATGGVSDALGSAFGNLLTEPSKVTITGTLSTSPCVVTGTRSMPPFKAVTMAGGPLFSFDWNGAIATNVQTQSNPFGVSPF